MALETAFLRLYSYFDTQGFSMTEKAKSALKGNYAPQNESQEKVIKVQFNPTELNFSLSGRENEEDKVSVNPGRNRGMEHAKAREQREMAHLKIPLIFDGSLSPKQQSVLSVVEGFLTMIEDAGVRKIDFWWGSLFYRGVLESASAEYQLFNAQGIPVRAKVDLELKLL